MDKLTALWHGAQYQDHLLQSYRKLHIILQSVLMAIGAGLSIVIIGFGNTGKGWLAYCLLVVVTLLGVYLLWMMRKLIASRSEDVNYYHNQIIASEQQLPKEQQVLTAFKVYQKYGRKEPRFNDFFQGFELTDAVRTQLIEKGKGHTRKLLDGNLFIGILGVWICFHIISLWGLLG